MDTFIHYGVAAGMQALRDAGLQVTDANAERIGVSVGAGIGGLPGLEKNYHAYLQGGPRKISPFFVPANIINMISGNLSIMYGLKGPNFSIVSACSTALFRRLGLTPKPSRIIRRVGLRGTCRVSAI